MAGSLFRRDIAQQTGITWENWIEQLEENCGRASTYDEIIQYLMEVRELDSNWVHIIAGMYEQLLGRKPVGLSADAGYQIGVRRTASISKEEAWHYLTSPDGLKLWIGTVSPFALEVGSTFMSDEGTFGKLGVVKPFEKLRMKWQRHDWENPSTLQIYLLSTNNNKTTIAFHQEKLDDLYMREVMKQHWEQAADAIIRGTASQE